MVNRPNPTWRTMEPEQSSASKRPSRRSAKSRNYDETLMDDLICDHLGPSSTPKRYRTLEEREKETEKEAMIALSLGFPIDALLEDEIRSQVVSQLGGAEQNNYIVVRNHILARWRANVGSWLSKWQIRETVSSDYEHLISKAYDFLLEQGYINFGVSSAVRSRVPDEPTNGSVIIVGSGLAGLAAAGQLLVFGFKVVVLEARNRPGGRVYTQRMGGLGKYAAVDLGGSIITGIHANPLGVLARQLSIPLHKVRDSCPLYRADGTPVDERLDSEVDLVFNKLLEKATQLREMMGDLAIDISLGSAIETIRKLYGVVKSSEERELLDWHLANLEYANAGCLSDLSVAYWDQDDPYEMDGDHCFLAGGNWRLINSLCENVPIFYGKTVTSIKYGDQGAEVVAGDQVYQADMVLCTVPLGVLKNGSVKFDPQLPTRKLGAIRRLGFGLLNKVAMVFPHIFWGEDIDTFGCLSKARHKRGECFLFYSYHTVSGGPVLIALVAGEAALEFERTDPVVMLRHVLSILRGIYGPRGIDVPNPIQTVCTRWGSDPLCYGSYSHVRVGSSGNDYDILAENVGGRLFFAGEATNRQYPATMHGAFLSGLREASRILSASRSRASMPMDSKKFLQKNIRVCIDVLIDLFRSPDLTFGNFSFIFDPSTVENPKAMGLMRLNLEEGRSGTFGNHHSRPEVEECKQSSTFQLRALQLYAILSREQAYELQLVSDGDRKKLPLLFKTISSKLMGCSSVCELGSSLILRIASSRKGRGRQRLADAPHMFS